MLLKKLRKTKNNLFIKLGNKKLKIKDCKGFASIIGLMFNNFKKTDGALIYANSVWMIFVKYDLDLFFLDENFSVIEIKHTKKITLNPKTWKIYKNKKAKYCLEIKSGFKKL